MKAHYDFQLFFRVQRNTPANMRIAFVLLALLGFVTEFSVHGLPRVDYNQFAKSVEQKLLHSVNGFTVFT